MRNLLVVTAVVAAGLGALSVHRAEAGARRGPDVRPVDVPAADTQSVLDGNAAFALESYALLAAEPGNLVYSPLSASTALSMVMAGARGETRDQLAASLHLTLPADRADAAFQSALASLRPLSAGVSLQIANSAWVSDGFSLQPGFASLLRRSYGAQARRVDFFGHPGDAAARINAWASQHTRRFIPRVISPEQIDPATKLLLANAVSLSAKWAQPFREDGGDAPFAARDGSLVTARMMTEKSTFPIYADPGVLTHDPFGPLPSPTSVAVLELPYRGGDWSMVVVLPARPDGLAAVEASLTPEKLRAWIDAAVPTVVNVALPRFAIESSFDLVPAMKSLGATDVFDSSGGADLSGIGAAPGELYVGLLAQKARIRVDAKGTEAAAVTTVGFVVTSVDPTPVFRADHPFLYVVRHRPTGTILFIGRVEDPTK